MDHTPASDGEARHPVEGIAQTDSGHYFEIAQTIEIGFVINTQQSFSHLTLHVTTRAKMSIPNIQILIQFGIHS